MSTYVDRTLANEESILHRAKFNWTYSLGATAWLLLSLFPLAEYAVLSIFYGVPLNAFPTVGWWFAVGAIAAGGLYMLLHIVFLAITEIVVTNYRFVYKTGLLTLNSKEVSLNKIEEITIHQNIFGRIFGYGKIVIRGTGVGVIELPDLDSPIRLRKIIENAKSNLRHSNVDERSGNAD